MKPPMIPHQGRAIDTVNFRHVKESNSSMDLGSSSTKSFKMGGGGLELKKPEHSDSGGHSLKATNATSSDSVPSTAKANGIGPAGSTHNLNAGLTISALAANGGVQPGGEGGEGGEGLEDGEGQVVSVAGLKGVPLDSGEKTPMGEKDTVDPFGEFNSVTLHHDGDDRDER